MSRYNSFSYHALSVTFDPIDSGWFFIGAVVAGESEDNTTTIHLLRIGSPTRRVQDDMKDSKSSEVDFEEWKIDGRISEKVGDVEDCWWVGLEEDEE